MITTTVYDFEMAKYIHVQFHAPQGGEVPKPLRIRADKIEKQDGGKTILKRGNETVGEFNTGIQGWWIEEDE